MNFYRVASNDKFRVNDELWLMAMKKTNQAHDEVEFEIRIDDELKGILAKKYGLNSLYSGKHWTVRKKDADFWHKYVADQIDKSKIKKEIFNSPVTIDFKFNTRMDIDNHGYLVKMIIDSLKGVFIVDDTRKYVKCYSVMFYDGGGIYVKIRRFNTE